MQVFYQEDGLIEYRPGELPPGFKYSYELLPKFMGSDDYYFVISCDYYDIIRKYYISHNSKTSDARVYMSLSLDLNGQLLEYEIKPLIYVYSRFLNVYSEIDKYILNTCDNILDLPYNREFEIYLDGKFISKNKVGIDSICSICHDEFRKPLCTYNNNNICKCPDCGNNIHKECIERWLKINKTCPDCRSDVWKYYVGDSRPPTTKTVPYIYHSHRFY